MFVNNWSKLWPCLQCLKNIAVLKIHSIGKVPLSILVIDAVLKCSPDINKALDIIQELFHFSPDIKNTRY